MKQVPLAALEDKLIRPGFEEHLKPLLRYKGHLSLGRVHRMWNLMVAAMEYEATSADITQRLVMNADYSQLCFPEKPVSQMSIRSFCGRLNGSPQVMAEAPGLREYLDWLLPPYKRAFTLERIPDPPEYFAETVEQRPISWAARQYGVSREVTERWYRELGIISPGNRKLRPRGFDKAARGMSLGWAVNRYDIGYDIAKRWFAEAGVQPVRSRQTPPGMVYPFLIHDGGKPEHRLLRLVNEAVPKGLPPSLRADMCQDLVVSILAGELNEDDILLPSSELTRRIWKSAPSRYSDMSLNNAISSLDETTFLDTLVDEGRDWA